MDQIGKYEVLTKIGSGGFAVVYKGYDPYIKRPVAIKVCFSRDNETRERFHREAEIAGRLVHRNITAVYDFGLHEQMPYLVEEYLPGEDLAHMIRRREPETLEEKLDVLLQISSGLSYAHSKDVIHRDIKPSNIRILDNGRVKIMDFGTAKLANVESNLTQTGMTLGTVAYLSPERLLGKASGTNSDIFSYGVLAYELLSFRRPFSGRNIPNLIDQVLNAVPVPLEKSWPACPPRLAEVVHRCLLKDPRERYAACEEVARDLEEVRTLHTARVSVPAPEIAGGAHLRISGLLEHARELHGRNEHRRAKRLLEEVLEIDPANAGAKRLLAACEGTAEGPAAATQTLATPTAGSASASPGAWEEPEARRRRTIDEAAAAIESYLEVRQTVRAAEALRFATEFLGDFAESATLYRRVVETLKTDVSEVREAGLRQARQLVETMTELRRRDLLPLELAHRLVERIGELDPGDLAGKHILASLHRDAPARAESPRSEARARKRQEAVDSIERLLSEGDPATAEEALQFAVSLLGEFEQIPRLKRRISEARRESGG